MSDLTDDEFALLEIASHGESMIPIGRWEKPLKSLAAKGMMFAADTANYVITESGRAALDGHKDDVDTAWAKAAIAAHNGAVVAQATRVSTLAVDVIAQAIRVNQKRLGAGRFAEIIVEALNKAGYEIARRP